MDTIQGAERGRGQNCDDDVTYYTMLGVDRTASNAQVREAAKRKLREAQRAELGEVARAEHEQATQPQSGGDRTVAGNRRQDALSVPIISTADVLRARDVLCDPHRVRTYIRMHIYTCIINDSQSRSKSRNSFLSMFSCHARQNEQRTTSQ